MRLEQTSRLFVNEICPGTDKFGLVLRHGRSKRQETRFFEKTGFLRIGKTIAKVIIKKVQSRLK
jgi:hypothetical protein